MLRTDLTQTEQDLGQILGLQALNLLPNLDDSEMQSQGFVTMRHNLEMLKQMHELFPSVIIRDGDLVIAYALMMPLECHSLVPGLEPMFDNFKKLEWGGIPLENYSYYVMGQVCVARDYRGQGIFDMLYEHHKKMYSQQFDFIITEVSTRNKRSLRAHERVGFRTIHVYRDQLDEWAVVLWDWS